jgi:hypothetical protein
MSSMYATIHREIAVGLLFTLKHPCFHSKRLIDLVWLDIDEIEQHSELLHSNR